MAVAVVVKRITFQPLAVTIVIVPAMTLLATRAAALTLVEEQRSPDVKIAVANLPASRRSALMIRSVTAQRTVVT